MRMQHTSIALLICSSLILTACSGGSNKSVSIPSSPSITVDKSKQENNASGSSEKEENPQKLTPSEVAKRNDLEVILDPNKKVKWRQLSAFIPSSDVDVNNPLASSSNGKISPQKGAAAYINGDAKYNDNGTKDFRDPQSRQSTDYDPEFLTKAEIDPNKLQSYAINNTQGNKVASAHFVNQKYSSYLSWKSEQPAVVYDEPIETVMTGYVAVPTNADKAILDRKVKATYKGHTIGNRDRSGTEFTLGNIQLDADFEKMQISGMITGRNDELLNHRAKYYGAGFKGVTTDQEEVDEGYTDLISQEDMAKRYEAHRKLDVKLLPTDIKVENGVISFKRSSDALEFQALNGDKVTTGSYGGIFAGPNAEEVVGEIQGGDNFISFGATEVQK